MTALSVNVNKIATLRNARGGNDPDLMQASDIILSMGVAGLTVHPRPDERHIRKQDAYDLKELVQQHNSSGGQAEYNIEGYPSDDFLAMIAAIRPDQCTLVPDPPDVLTSNAGWDLIEQQIFLDKVLAHLREHQVRSSIFVDPKSVTPKWTEALLALRPDRVELYTESYAIGYKATKQDEAVAGFQALASLCAGNDIAVNAGHDLNLDNLAFLLEKVPQIVEVSIGHALISQALYDGLESVIKRYLEICSYGSAHNSSS